MRGRSFHATLTAAALLAGSTALVCPRDVLAGDIDVFSQPAAPPTTFAPAAPAATSQAIVAPAAPVPAPTADPKPVVQPKPLPAALGDKDPEPDAAVKPAIPAPSKDPLDQTKIDAAKPATSAPALVAAPLPPLNAALEAALDKRPEVRGAQAGERRKERAAIGAYYEAHQYAPAWSKDGVPSAAVEPLLARLAKAGDDALTIPAPPTKLVAKGTPDEVAASDIALTEAVVAYARQASGARVDPRTISPLIGLRPEVADPAKVIDSVAAAGAEAGDRLAALNPSDPRYVALRDKLAALRGGRAGSGAPIPPGPTLKIGMHDGRVPQLRARLGLMASDLVADADEYDLELAEAVSGVQRSDGLPVSGRLDRATIAALAGGGKASPQEAMLAANMEMWRWMPRDLGRDRIEVDVPAYKVTVFHDGEPVASNRVVVGKTETPTPIFSNVMKYLIVNPVWNVPQSIIKKEMMPKMGRSGGLRGFDVSYHNGQMVVKQPSGEKNALGRIKFIFPNDFSVYLHDTPSKSLFSASKRAFSHGCVRVDQPFDFAFNVLNDSVPEGGKILWSEKRLDKMIGDSERYVNLPKPLPIHIEYFTASIDPETGRVMQREDIYGYAHAVAAALGGEARPAQMAEHKPKRVAEHAKTAVAADEDPR